MNAPTKVVDFQIIHFTDQDRAPTSSAASPDIGKPRQVLLLYALGEDGIIYEMTGGKWLPLPITENTLKKTD